MFEIESPAERSDRLNLPKNMERSKELLFFGQIKVGDGKATDVCIVRPFDSGPNSAMRVWLYK